MNKQISLSNLEDELSQVRTKKKEFLEQIDRIVPWNEWTAMIKPCYYKGERGNKPYDLGLMLRLYLIQNLYNLADEATVAEVTDSRAFSDFCGVESSNQIPDLKAYILFDSICNCHHNIRRASSLLPGIS